MIFMEAPGNQSKIVLSSAGGTLAAPTNSMAGTLGVLEFDGHLGGSALNYGRGADILVSSFGNFSVSQASTMQFRTWNSSSFDARIAIDENGYIGMGTTSPEGLLHLFNSAGNQLRLGHSNQPTAEWIFDSDVTGKFNLISENFGSWNTVLTTTNLGNVGIGTTSPNAKFHLDGSMRLNNLTATPPVVGHVLTATSVQGDAQWQALPPPPVNNYYFQATTGWTAQTVSGNNYYEYLTNLNTEVMDPSNSYNATTCEFTAPVTGLYSFSSYLTINSVTTSPGGVIFGFVVNNATSMNPAQVPIVVGSPGMYTTDENLSFSGLIYLNAGDNVKIGMYGADGGENFSVSYAGFSGFKVN
jgi:hypothetical protein